MSNESNQTGFDAEYVKRLREEAAGWRTKFRELEAQVAFTQVDAELARRGVKADPSWVTLEDNQTAVDAVEAFVKKHPYLVQQATEQVVQDQGPTTEKRVVKPQAPRPMSAGPMNSNSPGAEARDFLGKRDFSEVKKDPVARSKLRDHYRQLLSESSNQKDPSEY